MFCTMCQRFTLVIRARFMRQGTTMSKWSLVTSQGNQFLACLHSVPFTCSGELRTQKLKSHLVRTQSLNVSPVKRGVGQYIAIHATLTARDFFLAYFYPFGPLTCIFPNGKFSPDFSRVGCLLLTHGSCGGLQNKIGHPAGGRFPCRVPAEYK